MPGSSTPTISALCPADVDATADDVPVATETVLPRFMAQDGDGWQGGERRRGRAGSRLRPRSAVLVHEIAAERHARAKHPEEVGRHSRRPDHLGLGLTAAKLLPEGDERAGVLEQGALLAEIVEVTRRQRKVGHVPRSEVAPDRHQPVGIAIGQGTEQHRVHHAEDRGAGADTQRDGEDRGEGECGSAAQRAGGVPDLAQ